MKGVSKELIRKIVDELNGESFKKSESYSEKTKVFFVDRYFEILNLFPQTNKDDIGLEIGLAGGVLAFALQKQFNLNSLYTLEHPTASKDYESSFLKKLKANRIILKRVDLRDTKLPWKSNFFDFIFFCDVIEHLIPSDIPLVMKRFIRF